MRTQKRDRAERAYSKGYQTGLQGRSKELCPFQEHVIRQDWLNGWREGRVDHWEGYQQVNTISQV